MEIKSFCLLFCTSFPSEMCLLLASCLALLPHLYTLLASFLCSTHSLAPLSPHFPASILSLSLSYLLLLILKKGGRCGEAKRENPNTSSHIPSHSHSLSSSAIDSEKNTLSPSFVFSSFRPVFSVSLRVPDPVLFVSGPVCHCRRKLSLSSASVHAFCLRIRSFA